ncbi:hypothetical protein M2413_000121 [Pseudomonas putida]|nr:hypothetical protein [Pseudomonas putida]
MSLNFSTRAQAEFECACRNLGQEGDEAGIVGIG